MARAGFSIRNLEGLLTTDQWTPLHPHCVDRYWTRITFWNQAKKATLFIATDLTRPADVISVPAGAAPLTVVGAPEIFRHTEPCVYLKVSTGDGAGIVVWWS